MTADEVLALLTAAEARQADRVGFPAIEGRSAAEGLRALLERETRQSESVEMRVSLPDAVLQRTFLMLCSRYGVEVYRRPRQRGGNVTVRAPRVFIKSALEPLFQAMAEVFEEWYVEQTEAVLLRFKE